MGATIRFTVRERIWEVRPMTKPRNREERRRWQRRIAERKLLSYPDDIAAIAAKRELSCILRHGPMNLACHSRTNNNGECYGPQRRCAGRLARPVVGGRRRNRSMFKSNGKDGVGGAEKVQAQCDTRLPCDRSQHPVGTGFQTAWNADLLHPPPA